MLRVGLTGGVGSGKSAAVAMLRELGAYISQSDEVGRLLMQPGQAVFNAIVAHFGPQILTQDGQLDRTALARIAFGEGRVEELNAIVHPVVIAAQAQWFDEVAARDPKAVAVVESALIFETKHGAAAGKGDQPWRTRFDRIIVVSAPIEVRRQRYIRRINVSEDAGVAAAVADFDRRAAAQWTDEEKAQQADYVIENSGTLNDLRGAIVSLYARLQQESALLQK